MEFLFDKETQSSTNADKKPFAEEKPCLFCKFDIPLRKYSEHTVQHHFQNRNQKCFQCEKVFSAWNKFQRHWARAHQNGVDRFRCNVCDKLFSRKITFERHVKIHAKIQPIVVIDQKKNKPKAKIKRGRPIKRTTSVAALPLPAPSVKIQFSLFACMFCKKPFDDKLSLMVHLKTACVLEQFRFYCSFCPQVIADDTIENHLRRFHFNGIKPATPRRCRICHEASQRDFANWVYHIEQNHATVFLQYDRTPIAKQCQECRTGFACYGLEVSHCELTHGIQPIYECKQCPASFETEDLFAEHVELHFHSNTPMCTHCKQPFQCQLDLQLHLGGSIFMQEYIDLWHSQPDSATQCGECGWMASSAAALAEHVKNHRYKFECPTCKRKFYNEIKYNNHIIEHVEKESRCPYCTFVSPFKEVIQAHMDDGTCLVNPFECDYCEKSFSRMTSLQIHRRRLHTSEKCDLCWVCGETVYKTSFDKHMESHGARDCSSENLIFTKKQIKMHSLKSVALAPKQETASEIKYNCGQCPKTFTRMYNLKRHNTQRH